jgi:putative glutamine amidotransferase
MNRFLLTCLVVVFSFSLTAQNFFSSDFNQKKDYIILTNPTVWNLKTIDYLVDNKLLKINTRKTDFVGVYFDDQNYNFSQTAHFLDTAKLNGFHLHEVKGELDAENIFRENSVTDELKKIFENSAGVFFFGGPDIPPLVYGEENTHSVVTDPERHFFETTFLFHLLGSYRNEQFEPFLEENPDYFVTGFCLGMQTMNVATGGTMIQDIPAELFGAETPESTVKIGQPNLHRNYWQEISEDTLLMGFNFHTVRFTDHPFFGRNVKVGKSFRPKILSSHHQAVKKLGKNLEVTALSPDGKIIEGIAHSHYPNVFAVQFHPEVPALYENMELRKFHPSDSPDTYHHILGKECVKFHKEYWKFVSSAIKDAVKAKN